MKKRLLALMMAAVLTMGMSMTAFAEEGKTYSIKIEQVEGATEKHTYEAYQIFKGELATDNQTLSNIEWGENINYSAGVTYKGVTYTEASALAEALKEETDAKDFATAIAEYITGDPIKSATETAVRSGVVIDELPDGYYFVKDKDESLVDDNDNDVHDSYSRYMIQIAGSNVTVTAKADVPSTEKKVKDKNDAEGTETEWQDSADYDIGDKVPFQFSSTIVDNIADYKNAYVYTFHDVESEGLTFNNDVTMTVGGKEYKDFKVVTKNSTTEPTTDGCTFEVITGDLRNVAQPGDEVVVNYTSTLNEKAVIGSVGNRNKMKLKYTNNPNGDGTGETPEDEVIVFTYKVVINKVDENNKPLAGAEFTLFKKYTDGYKEVKKLSATPLDAEGNELKVDKNGIATDKDGNVKEIASYTFSFKGLDDGQYKLKETTTPDGYNTMDPVEFKVVATHTNDDAGANALKLTDLNGNPITGSIDLGFTSNKEDGSLTADVINKQGSLLPSTGGIGTTIFYVIGGILVIGAGVILFTRKRMSVED